MNKRCLLVLLLFFIASCDGERSAVTKLFPVKTAGYYGYIDRSGKTAIPFRYARAGCFEGGVAVVETAGNGRWGYIDNDGNYVIKPTYSYATSFSEGLAWVVPEDDVPTVIDKNGIVQFRLPDAQSAENFSDGLAAYSILGTDGEKWGFVDKKGKTVIEPQFSGVSYFSGGLCGVMNSNNTWGYINTKGKVVINYLYQNVYPFKGDKAKVAAYGKFGVIDKKGKYVLAPKYADVDLDGEGYLAKDGKKWGWFNEGGEETISVQFADAYPFLGNKFAPVMVEEKWGFIDGSGKFVIAPQFEFAFGFDGGMALVEAAGKYGFIDEAGQFVINPDYEHVPVDYFIRYFAKTSAFYSVKTDIDNPRNTAYKWLTGFYHMDYNEARKYATENTRALLDQFMGVTDMIADSTRQRMAGVMIGIKDYKEVGNRAIVTYTLSDNRSKEQQLWLVKVDNKWRVQFPTTD